MELEDLTPFRIFSLSFGPSGLENEIKRTFIEIIKDYIDCTFEDTLGNLYCIINGECDETIALVAHCDEVGFMVKFIEESGMIRFSSIGAIDISTLRGTRVSINHCGKKIPGIIGSVSTKFFQVSSPLYISDLWIDIGACDKHDAESKVSIGDYISYEPFFQPLNNRTIACTSADNRSGVYTLFKVIKLLKETKPYYSIAFILTVQEELGSRGATVAASILQPKECIVVDVTNATDCPNINKAMYGDIKLGEGFVIPIGSNFSQQLQTKIINLSINNSFKHQIEAKPESSGTDSKIIQISNKGVPTGQISIPCRYIHSPFEIVSLDDINNAVLLLEKYCQQHPYY